MIHEATLQSPAIAARGAGDAPPNTRVSRGVLSGALIGLSVALAVAGWRIHQGGVYTSAKGIGYALGLCGGLLILALLAYPVRKRIRLMHNLGPLKYWFRLHMVGGVLGPLLVVFHSTFHVRSFNAAVALCSMLLVAGSGLAVRFLYRKIHHGLYGSRATLQELQLALAPEMES